MLSVEPTSINTGSCVVFLDNSPPVWDPFPPRPYTNASGLIIYIPFSSPKKSHCGTDDMPWIGVLAQEVSSTSTGGRPPRARYDCCSPKPDVLEFSLLDSAMLNSGSIDPAFHMVVNTGS